MKSRSLIVHGVLAVAALLAAYLVAFDDTPELAPGEVTLLACDEDEVERLQLVVDDKDVTLEVREQDGERVVWITVTRRPERGEPTTERFVGSQAAIDWLEEIAPLRASRSLGELTRAQLGEVGLVEPEGRFVMRCGGRSVTYQLGNRSYGNGDRYARARSGGPVYLLSNEKLQALESAEFRLMQREIHTFESREIVSVRVRAFDQEKTFVQRNRQDQEGAVWVDSADQERRNESYGNWMAHFGRLRVQRYLGARERPGADLEGISTPSVPVLRMDYQGEEEAIGHLELVRVDAAEPAYYVRTETTRSWVRVATSVAQQIEDDARPLFGLEPIERPTVQPDAGVADAGIADAGATLSTTPDAGAQAPAEAAPPAEPTPPAEAAEQDAGARRRPRPEREETEESTPAPEPPAAEPPAAETPAP